MKRSIFFLFFAVAMCICAMTTQAQAQATRTWVSGVGDDANPCSRTAPCKTFAGAVSKTADCGEIDALDPAGYGTITLTKGIKIDGGGGEAGQVASILATSGVPGVTINNTSATCLFDVLRNLDINGIQSGGVGVNVVAGKNLSIENVDIENMTAQCINFQPVNAMNLIVYSSNLENCTTGGIVASTTSGINHVNVEKSTIQRSGVGLTVHANTNASVHNTMINNNPSGGVLADTNGTAQVMLDLSQISNNQAFGVHSTSGAFIRMANSSVTYNNGIGLLADAGGNILTWGNNWVDGNTPGGGRTGLNAPQ